MADTSDVPATWYDARRMLGAVGFALLSVGTVMAFVGDPDDHLWRVVSGCGWLVLGLANTGSSPISRAVRNLVLGLAAMIALGLGVHVLPIEVPFSVMISIRIQAAIVLLAIVLVTTYIIRALLEPKSDDFLRIEAAHSESLRRERHLRNVNGKNS